MHIGHDRLNCPKGFMHISPRKLFPGFCASCAQHDGISQDFFLCVAPEKLKFLGALHAAPKMLEILRDFARGAPAMLDFPFFARVPERESRGSEIGGLQVNFLSFSLPSFVSFTSPRFCPCNGPRLPVEPD